MNKRREREVKDVSTVLDKLFDKKTRQRIKDAEALIIWDEVVGEEIAKVSQAESLIAGTLIVKVSHPVWRVELSRMSNDIQNKLNRRMGRSAVRRIRFL
jgi:predicted nucleic acid-binding Zn ribbon protein